LASLLGCWVTGITLSERQVQQAITNMQKKNISDLVDFEVMDYSATTFTDAGFDMIWGCESICYADDKEKFIKEAYRLLKSGGRLVVAIGFVPEFENNENPIIRQWLDGWQVNYLESAQRFETFMRQNGFTNIGFKNISKETAHSSRRLYKYYFLGSLFLLWKKINFSKSDTEMQKKEYQGLQIPLQGNEKRALALRPDGWHKSLIAFT
jgi:ubiquinone/menaquinone biosynthesis C-methylase UbiE